MSVRCVCVASRRSAAGAYEIQELEKPLRAGTSDEKRKVYGNGVKIAVLSLSIGFSTVAYALALTDVLAVEFARAPLVVVLLALVARFTAEPFAPGVDPDPRRHPFHFNLLHQSLLLLTYAFVVLTLLTSEYLSAVCAIVGAIIAFTESYLWNFST